MNTEIIEKPFDWNDNLSEIAQESITWIVGKDNCQVAVRNMPIDKMQKICAIIGEEEQQPSEDWHDVPSDEMTLEQARQAVKDLRKKLAEHLEQQPCEDCISREALFKNLEEPMNWTDSEAEIQEQRDYEGFIKLVKSMPSVTPTYTDEQIQKMQELEQAGLEKAYELGKAESFEEWLSSFNTESATCCFTAVQELKKKLEDK